MLERELIDYTTSTSAWRRSEREFFTNNLLVRIHLIIEMIWWTGLAVQGHLAHKKQLPPLEPPQGPGHVPTVGS